MARTRRGALLTAAILLLAAGLAYSQAGSATRTYQLVINVDVPGATISVDNVVIKGNTANVTGGIHRITVKADGYEDYIENASVTSDRTLTIRMKARVYQVTIKANVANATLVFDGAKITGTVVSAASGFHTLRITAPGYDDYSTTINVTGPVTVNAQLQQQRARLLVNSNVVGALVSLNGVAKGVTPYSEDLQPGAYTVKVSAKGYVDYVTTVSLMASMTINAELRATGYQLSVNSNVRGALVSINNVLKGAAPYSEVLAPGSYTVKVTAAGYLDYVTNVSLTQPVALTAELRPAGYQLSVNSNVQGAVVSINNAVKGTTPYSEVLAPGSYTVKVSANGYTDYVTSVSLTQAVALNAELRASGYQLSVNSNVQGAVVSINNVVKGAAPYAEVLPPGNYTVKVTATGFLDYVTTVALERPVAITAQLQSGMTTFSLSLPAAFLDPDAKDVPGQIRIYVDGKFSNTKRELSNIPITAGRHSVRVISGVFSIEIAEMDFQPGVNYVFELSMDLKIKTTGR